MKHIISITEKANREFLRALCLDRDEKKMVATNGHVQLMIDAPELEGTGQIIVPKSALEAAYKLTDRTMPISFTDRAIKVGAFEVPFTSASFLQRSPDGTQTVINYPKWKSVVPPDKTENDFGQFGFYNSKYVVMIEQLTPIFGKTVTSHLPTKHDGILQVYFGDTATLLVMPCERNVANRFYGEENGNQMDE